MRKTFNYTGRKRLFYKGEKPDFSINLNDESNYTCSFELELTNFEKFKSFPPDSSITLDCFNSNYFNHKNFGLISDIEDKKLPTETVPTEAESLRFDLKVINKNKSIIAMAKNINPNKSIALFGTEAKDMKDIWKTEIGDGLPLIYLNKDLKIKQKLANHDPKTLLMILPAAFRDFLRKFVTFGYLENKDTWALHWMRFAEKFTKEQERPNNVSNYNENKEQWEQWIEKFSENYTYEILEKKFKIKEKYKDQEDK